MLHLLGMPHLHNLGPISTSHNCLLVPLRATVALVIVVASEFSMGATKNGLYILLASHRVTIYADYGYQHLRKSLTLHEPYKRSPVTRTNQSQGLNNQFTDMCLVMVTISRCFAVSRY